MTLSRLVLPALFLFALACGGGGSSTPTAIPTGVYLGTGQFTGNETINGATHSFNSAPFLVAIVTAAGNYQLLSYSADGPDVISQLDRGSGTVVNGSFGGSTNIEAGLYPNYNSNAFPILAANQGAALSSTYAINTNLNGTLSYPGAQSALLTFPLTFAAGSATAATSAPIAKSFTGAFYSNVNTGQNINLAATATIAISAAGALSGTVTCPFTSVSPPPGPSTPCSVAGTLSPRADVNAYDVSLAFTNGSSTGFPSFWVGKTATGLGYYDASSGKLRFGAAASDNTAFAFSN